MNKRGLLNEIWIVIILFIVLLAGIFAYWLFAMTAPIVIGESFKITSTLQTAFASGHNDSLNNATNVAVNTANSFLGMVEGAIYLAFLGGLLGFLAICYYVKTFKWLAMVWLMLIVAAVVISMVLSNAYQDTAATSTDLSNLYSLWGTNNFLLLNLPYIIGGFGVVSGIILFAIVAIGSDEETTEIK